MVAQRPGGAIYASSGSIMLANDTFDSNQAVGGPGGEGGTGGSGGREAMWRTAVPPIQANKEGQADWVATADRQFSGAIYVACRGRHPDGIHRHPEQYRCGRSRRPRWSTAGPGTAEVGTLTGIFGGSGNAPPA